MVGFFKSPMGGKKKKVTTKGIVDLETFVSPTPSNSSNNNGGGQQQQQQQQLTLSLPTSTAAISQDTTMAAAASLALAPPLFDTFSDTDHRLLKTLKRGKKLRRHTTIDSSPGAQSVETGKQRLSLSSSAPASAMIRASSRSLSPNASFNDSYNSSFSRDKATIIDNLGLSPFVGPAAGRVVNRRHQQQQASIPLPDKLPLLDDNAEEEDGTKTTASNTTSIDPNNHNSSTTTANDNDDDEEEKILQHQPSLQLQNESSMNQIGSESFSSLGGDMNKIINTASSGIILATTKTTTTTIVIKV